MEEEKKNWIDEMIIREATPKQLRTETVEEFCKKWGIGDSTYYYQSSKPENQNKSIKIALQNAKKYTPEVLENLAERAKNNSKDAEMFLKYVLELASKTDITSNGLSITFADIFNADSTRTTKEDSSI